jgi:hypothetical protein
MTDQAPVTLRLAGVQRLLQRIEHEVRAHRTAHPPTHDAPCVHVDHEGHIQPALPGRDVGEVRDPELIGPVGPEHTVDPVQRAWLPSVADRGAHHLATAHALQAQAPHQPLDRAARNGDAFAVELLPDLVGAVDLHVGVPHALDVRHQDIVTLSSGAASLRVALFAGVAPIA